MGYPIGATVPCDAELSTLLTRSLVVNPLIVAGVPRDRKASI